MLLSAGAVPFALQPVKVLIVIFLNSVDLSIHVIVIFSFFLHLLDKNLILQVHFPVLVKVVFVYFIRGRWGDAIEQVTVTCQFESVK